MKSMMTREELANTIKEIFAIEDPSINHCKKAAFAIANYDGDTEDGFEVVKELFDYGIMNMVIDEYNFYFKERYPKYR